jgi:hypothetical protein
MHEPQFSVAPHPSAIAPHVFPCAAQVVGTHAQTLLLPQT